MKFKTTHSQLIKRESKAERLKVFYNLHYANHIGTPLFRVEVPQTILRSFFRRILTHLVKDMEMSYISCNDFMDMSRDLKKILYKENILTTQKADQ